MAQHFKFGYFEYTQRQWEGADPAPDIFNDDYVEGCEAENHIEAVSNYLDYLQEEDNKYPKVVETEILKDDYGFDYALKVTAEYSDYGSDTMIERTTYYLPVALAVSEVYDIDNDITEILKESPSEAMQACEREKKEIVALSQKIEEVQ
ncbi:hypothetical protein OFO01_07465 [Campylobacter sp. JMF_01 NE2]|uniref:hypothetical protein n=1 Tax=unclassified Campylobacter TaxID=2593542 RepID=UPI0022E99AC4|nr:MULTISPECIES: hypothetical protein [unclassified Campylobacter]MDA3053197.1 hypothetical protein [Campylobacter sp. JMF_03 NE3]MDA3067620.1 hypothetical protein [Campylobacter sp. JMF_01 NE2]